MALRIITRLLPMFSSKPSGLGRWNTQVAQEIKDRRVDLANIDSCGDEICSNPEKLNKLYPNKYYSSQNSGLDFSSDLHGYYFNKL